MKNTKRRLTSWILTLMMLLTLVPVMGGSANAAEYSTGAGSVSVDAYGNVTVTFTVTQVPGQQNLYGFGLCLFTDSQLKTANGGSFPNVGTKLKNSGSTNFDHCSHVYTQMFADGYYVNNFTGNQEYTLTFPAESMEKIVSSGDVHSFLKDKTDGVTLADILAENPNWYVVVGPITTWNGSPSTNCDIYLGPSSDVLARPSVTVTYDANGGSGTMDPQTYVAGTDIDIPVNGFTPPEGKVFAGFKSESGGTIYANVNDSIDGATTNFRIFDDLTLYAQWREPGGEQNPDVELGTIVNLGDNCITVDGNTVTVNKPEGDDEYIYFLTVLPEIYLEGTGMTAEQYVERHMLGVDQSIIDATTLDLTDVPGIQELANTTQIFVTNIETYESLDGYISGDSVVVVLKLHPDNVKVATYDSAADNPYFGSVGFTTAYAYGIYGVYATRVSAGAGAEVASAELTFTYEETIGAIVAGEELPDLSVLAPEHVVVKDTDGNVLTVVDVYADWLCKAPDLDEGWGWPDSNIAQDGMEYGIRIEVIGDGSYSFGTSWDDLTVLTCQDEKLSVNSAWVGDPNSAFVAFIEMSTVQQPEPPHEHSYAYTSNGNGTHNGACECGEDAITNEACTYVDGTCSKCGYEEPVAPETYEVIVNVKEKTEGDEYVDCDDAKVTLIGLNGDEQVKTQSVGNGVYVFENVANGVYNLVIQSGDKVKTILVTIDGENVDLGVVILPAMEVNSKVDVTVDIDGDSPIEGALVGGLDQLAEEIADEIDTEDGVSVSVEVSMQINTQMSDDVDAEHKSDIEEEARTQSENLTFLDITIDKTITTQKTGEDAVETTDPIHDTVNLLEIIIPFDTDGRYDFAVYRYHEDHHTGNNVQKLTTTPNSDNEYIKVEDGVIKMYVRYFSTYAIGFSDDDTPKEYTVTFSDGAGNTETVYVIEGETLTLPECEFTAPEGQEFKAWEVNGTEYAVGDTIAVTANIIVKAVWKDVEIDVPTPPVRPSYDVNVEEVVGGTIRVTPKTAATGSIVTVIVTPDEGYELVELIITTAAGKDVKWTSVGDDKYTFVMPYGEVSVNAIFAKIKETCPKDSTCPIWPFKDASTTAWYHDGVHYCIENGLMYGLPGNLFDPNGTTTRAQIVTILWRLEGEPYANYAMSFADVAAGQWYTEAVRWAAANGIVNGYSDSVFAPNDAITREQMAAILWRYCQYKGIDVSVGEETNILSYSDALDVHSWAVPAMQWACGAGVINGIADGNSMKLDPTGSATRAQVATMLWRFCVEIMEP